MSFLSLHFQVKLEQIRQAESLNQVKQILGEEIEEETDLPADATWKNKYKNRWLFGQTKRKRLCGQRSGPQKGPSWGGLPKKCIDMKTKWPLLHTWVHNASNDLKTYGINMIPYQSGQIGIANTWIFEMLTTVYTRLSATAVWFCILLA